jgi:outer membrane receptor protein involved in Fe transport
MRCLTFVRRLGQLGLLAGVLVAASAARAVAQTTTGSIRGSVKDQNGSGLGGSQIEASNVGTGVVRATAARADGSYILVGLVPGTYDITARHIGNGPQRRRVDVQIGATLIADFALPAGAVELATVTVSAAPLIETRTSEVATNVSPEQIQRLPTPSRNFLDLAALAPGVTVSPDFVNMGGNTTSPRTFLAGAQGPGAVNVFIDGASLKNDLTGNGASGVAGQDASRGNPFPRNAIQEYRVLTQNFKAEYQKASSAIITATTKSGGNTWSGDAFASYENKDLVALDSITEAKNRNNPKFKKPDYSRYIVGLSGGGPLIRDRLFFFGSYEGNYQNRANLVNIAPLTGFFPALDSVPFTRFNGNLTSPFRETLLFGKLNYVLSDHSSAELSVSNRHETDVRDFGDLTTFQAATNFRNNATTGLLKYNYFTGAWLNEASVTYERFQRNPTPNTPGLAHRTYRGFVVSPTSSFGGAELGSNLSAQDFTQKRLGLRDNVTYTGSPAHVFKAGVSVDFLSYDINKANNETPQFFYDDTVSAGDANCGCPGPVGYNYRNPYQVQFALGNPLVSANNAQIGAFLQDDWSPTSRLTLNLGVRWDFETHMFNYDYVTPQDVRDTITRYNNDPTFLPSPINLSEYFTDGTQRKKFYGSFQPRLGFSYALDAENKTTLFGGWGLFYDRTFFDLSVDEKLKLTRPLWTVYFADSGATPAAGRQVAWSNRYLTNRAALDSLAANGSTGFREAWLIGNNVKVPHSMQWNVGVRHMFGDVLVSAAYAGVRGRNGLVLNWANIVWNNFGTDSSGCCTFRGNAHGFSNVIVTSNTVKTWYDALQVQIVRPYRNTGKFGWGGGLSFTSGQRSIAGNDNPDDLLAFPQSRFIPKHPLNDEKSRVVANWIVDLPFAYGIQWSGLMTLGSGPRYDISGRFDPKNWRPGGFSPPQYPFLIPGAWAFRNVDMRLSKSLPEVGRGTINVTVDVFNVFNFQNFTYFGGNPIPSGLLSDPRRVQLGVGYHF